MRKIHWSKQMRVVSGTREVGGIRQQETAVLIGRADGWVMHYPCEQHGPLLA